MLFIIRKYIATSYYVVRSKTGAFSLVIKGVLYYRYVHARSYWPPWYMYINIFGMYFTVKCKTFKYTKTTLNRYKYLCSIDHEIIIKIFNNMWYYTNTDIWKEFVKFFNGVKRVMSVVLVTFLFRHFFYKEYIIT